jgi:hypothetical protein
MDPLAQAEVPQSVGLFVKLEDGKPIKIRVLTTDPLVNMDKYGNTRYSFIVWNFTVDKAQILQKGVSIFKRIKELHTDEDYGANIKNIDLKLTATGTGKETRYTIDVLPKATKLSNEQIKEAMAIDLEAKIDNGIRLSEVNKGAAIPGSNLMDEIDLNDRFSDDAEGKGVEEEIDLNDIPF